MKNPVLPAKAGAPAMEGRRIRAGAFTLTRLEKGGFWLCNHRGEGMAASETKVAELLEGFFNREY